MLVNQNHPQRTRLPETSQRCSQRPARTAIRGTAWLPTAGGTPYPFDRSPGRARESSGPRTTAPDSTGSTSRHRRRPWLHCGLPTCRHTGRGRMLCSRQARWNSALYAPHWMTHHDPVRADRHWNSTATEQPTPWTRMAG